MKNIPFSKMKELASPVIYHDKTPHNGMKWEASAN